MDRVTWGPANEEAQIGRTARPPSGPPLGSGAGEEKLRPKGNQAVANDIVSGDMAPDASELPASEAGEDEQRPKRNEAVDDVVSDDMTADACELQESRAGEEKQGRSRMRWW